MNDQNLGGDAGPDLGASAASAAGTGLAAVKGALKGAKGGVGGAALGAAKALAKDKNGRKILAGVAAVAMLPAVAFVGVAVSLVQVIGGASTQEVAAAEAAQLSGIEDVNINRDAAAASGTRTPWYILAAIDHAESADQETNPYGLLPAAQDLGAPPESAHAGPWLAVTIQNAVETIDPDFSNADWAMMTGLTLRESEDGSKPVPDADDRERLDAHHHAVDVWTEAVKTLPIRNAGARAPGIVETAFKLATGNLINGCGAPGGGTNPSGITVADGTWVNPAAGRRTSEFGMRTHPVTGVRKLHTGSDIANSLGTPIYAAANGVVTVTGRHPSCGDGACGAVIEVDHGSGVKTRYLHMSYSDHLVSIGDSVAAGQQIGAMNTQGYSTGVHLHFEVLVNGEFVDPVAFLADRGADFGGGPVGAASQTGSAPVMTIGGGNSPPASAGNPVDGDPTSVTFADPTVKHIPYTEAEGAKAGITESMSLRKGDGTAVTVSKEALYNAAVVVHTIRGAAWPDVSDQDKDRLAVAALITMAQESTFYTNPRSRQPDSNNDTGPFQQRSLPGWYADGATQAENVAILQSIPYATLTFIEGHKVPEAVPGGAGPAGYVIPGVFQKDWRSMEPWEVAVKVQVPAKSTYHHYTNWQPVAEGLVAALSGTAVSFGQGSNLFGCGNTIAGGWQTGSLNLQAPAPWGGHTLGEVSSGLCDATVGSVTVQLRCDAAKSLETLVEEFSRFGTGNTFRIDPASGYKTAAQLAQCRTITPLECSDAHGWGLAVDVDPTSDGYRFMLETEATLGWKQPETTRDTHPGHFEFYTLPGEQATGWERGVKPAAVNIGRYVKENYPEITSIGGHRMDTTPDHPSGRAIDVMIPDYKTAAGVALGDRMAEDLKAKAGELGVSYLIWNEKIWSVARDSEGWRPYRSKNPSDSARHIDHLHINVY